MVREFTVDIRKLTYAELWRIAPGFPFLIAFCVKLFRVPLKIDTTVPLVDKLTILEPHTIDADIRDFMAGPMAEWQGLWFKHLFTYTIPLGGSGQRACAAVLLSADGFTTGQAMFAEKVTPQITRRRVVSSCFTKFADGTFFGVSSEKKQMESPPGVSGVNLPGKSPRVLYARHEAELKKITRTYPVRLGEKDVEPAVLWLNNHHVEFHAQRGVYVPKEGTPGAPIG